MSDINRRDEESSELSKDEEVVERIRKRKGFISEMKWAFFSGLVMALALLGGFGFYAFNKIRELSSDPITSEYAANFSFLLGWLLAILFMSIVGAMVTLLMDKPENRSASKPEKRSTAFLFCNVQT